MIKRIAVCALLALVLVPAFAMAAGPQGQGSATGQEKGPACQGAGPAGSGMAQGTQQKFMNQADFGSGMGQGQMEKNRICNQTCDGSGAMTRNQSGFMSAGMVQGQQDRARNMTKDAVMDRIQDRIRLHDGSCGNCRNISVS